MAYAFGTASEAKLKTLHPDIVRVLRRAMSYQLMDFTIFETARSASQAAANAAKGTGIVNSKHLVQADGYAHAADVYPYPTSEAGKTIFQDTKRFNVLAGIILAAAKEEKVKIRWGGNWDGDNQFRDNSLEDLPHFELVQ